LHVKSGGARRLARLRTDDAERGDIASDIGEADVESALGELQAPVSGRGRRQQVKIAAEAGDFREIDDVAGAVENESARAFADAFTIPKRKKE